MTWRIAEELEQRRRAPESLIRVAAEIEQQRRDARTLLAPLLASPLQFTNAAIERNPKFHSPGVIDVLIGEAAAVRDRQPQFALAMANAAIGIAMDVAIQDKLRGPGQLASAWAERAIALGMIGKFRDAEKAARRAEKLYEQDPRSTPHDLACVWLTQSVICLETDRIGEAQLLARSAAAHFAEFGDTARCLKARLAIANVLFMQQQYAEAAQELEEVVSVARAENQRLVLLRALQSLGECHASLSRFDAATDVFVENIALADELHTDSDRMRATWALGNVLLLSGSYDEAIARLDEALRGFDSLRIVNEAALVRLQLAEALLVAGRHDEVPSVLENVVVTFSSEGMMRNASIALAYLREVVQERRAVPELVRHVRAYLTDLPGDPTRNFAPPQ